MVDTPTVDALLEQWISAFNRRDLSMHMELYTEDAILFGSEDELQVGREAIRAYFSRRGPNVHVKSYPMPRIAMLSPNIAVTAGHVDFADGNAPMPYRMTWALVKRGGNWRITQHHGSPRRDL
jgi:uncharacterized protein (TIGR02246 family)